MSTDQQIIEDMVAADRIKAAAPGSGVSADAIFIGLRGLPRRNRPPMTGVPKAADNSPPSDHFLTALAALKGRALTVGEFMFYGGMYPANKKQKNEAGRWLRGTGRKPRKSGGKSVFDL